MGWQEIVAVMIALGCGVYALRFFYREVTNSNNCGCGAISCGNKQNARPIQITLEQDEKNSKQE